MVADDSSVVAVDTGADRHALGSGIQPGGGKLVGNHRAGVAALRAATGRSNKQIASAMYLSVRTVENRLQPVYEKLGASGRHELVEVLGVRVTVDLVA